MKLFNAIAAAAAVITYFAGNPIPAEARNGWVLVGHNSEQGETHYVKQLSSGWPNRLFIDKISGIGEFKAEINCQLWRRRWLRSDGSMSSWKDVMPGSWGESKAKIICR